MTALAYVFTKTTLGISGEKEFSLLLPLVGLSDKNICINVCIIKIHVPRAHEVKNQRVIAKRTSQIMKYGQDVIIQKRTDDNIQ